MDKKHLKSIFSALLTLLILVGIMALVLRGNVEAIMNSIASISAPSLIALLALGLGYQLLDSAMCMTLVRSRLPELSYRQAFELTFLGVFGLVTSGGAATIPMQSGYLYNQGLDVGNSVGLMIMKYIFHKGTIFLYALIMLVTQSGWLGANLPSAGKYLALGFGFCLRIILILYHREKRHIGLAVELQCVHILQLDIVAVLVGEGDKAGAKLIAHEKIPPA